MSEMASTSSWDSGGQQLVGLTVRPQVLHEAQLIRNLVDVKVCNIVDPQAPNASPHKAAIMTVKLDEVFPHGPLASDRLPECVRILAQIFPSEYELILDMPGATNAQALGIVVGLWQEEIFNFRVRMPGASQIALGSLQLICEIAPALVKTPGAKTRLMTPADEASLQDLPQSEAKESTQALIGLLASRLSASTRYAATDFSSAKTSTAS